MNMQTSEFEIIQQIVPELEAEGYEVFLQPSRHLVPEFLKGHRPDAIARGAKKSLVIEVIKQTDKSDDRAAKIAGLFKGRKDWELRIIWVTPTSRPREISRPSPAVIRKRIEEVRALSASKYNTSALILAWAALEAIGRQLVPDELQRPQTPARLIQILSSKGYVTPSEADKLRSLADKRNRSAHGEFGVRVTKSDVEVVLNILDAISNMMGRQRKNGQSH